MAQSDDILKLLGDTLSSPQPSGATSTPTPTPQEPKRNSDDLLELLKNPSGYKTPEEKTAVSKPPLGVAGTINDEVNFAGTQLTKGALAVGALPNTVAASVKEHNEKYGDLPQMGSSVSPGMNEGVPELGGRGQGLANILSSNWPSYQELHDFVFKKLGVPERDPQGPIEKIAAPGLQAIPAGLAMGAPGMAFAGGVTGELGAEAAPEHPEAARFIGSLLGPVGLTSSFNLAQKGITAAKNMGLKAQSISPLTQQVLQEAKDIGVDVPKYMAAETQTAPQLATTLQKVPGAGEPITKSAEAVGEQLGNAAAKTRLGYGSATRQTAGADASSAISDWMAGKSNDALARVYDNVDKLTQSTPLQSATGLQPRRLLVNTAKISDEIAAERVNAGLEPSSAVRHVETASSGLMGGGQGMDYTGVKTLRTSVGEMIDGKTLLPAGMSKGELKRIYSGLSDDMANIVQSAGGPEATAAFNHANTVAKIVADRRNQLTKIVGLRGDAPGEQVYDKIISMSSSKSGADIEKLGMARKAAGEDAWNNIASARIQNMGFDGNGNFSPDRFLTQWNSHSDAGRRLLFNSTQGSQKLYDSLQKIANVSQQFKDNITKFANPSGTGHSVVGFGTVVEAVKAPLTTLTAIMGGRYLAKALSKPATADQIAKWSANYNRVLTAPTASNKAAYVGSLSALYNSLYH